MYSLLSFHNLSTLMLKTAIDFSQRPKILKMIDEDPTVSIKLDGEQLVRDLKQIDPNRWEPLPVNVK